MSEYRVAVFSTKPYDQKSFLDQNETNVRLTFFDVGLNSKTVTLCQGFDAICVFVNDVVDKDILETLAKFQVQAIVLRCAGFNNVDLNAARRHGIHVAHVPAYSPEAVAEHTIALIMTLNRKLHKAYNRTKEDNFSLQGLLGFNIHGKTVGLIGTGKIGLATARIFKGFGAKVIATDPQVNPLCEELGVQYKSLEAVLKASDIVSLHCPLNASTQHIVNCQTIKLMKPGVMIINTGRGALIDSQCLIDNLKSGHIGYLALDVYEQESELFFEDRSDTIVQDDVFQRLLTFPNVLITGHQGFFTHEALTEIATTTLDNALSLEKTGTCPNIISRE